jgi:hypothetical protein
LKRLHHRTDDCKATLVGRTLWGTRGFMVEHVIFQVAQLIAVKDFGAESFVA